jgi:hypothetical protein
MGDRELLELAAKAAGIGLLWSDEADNSPRLADNKFWPWNPLTDDGDALRLAAALRLQIKPGKHKGDGCTVETQRSGIAGCTAFYDDEAQQMRRAIVCAAAEIGKTIP